MDDKEPKGGEDLRNLITDMTVLIAKMAVALQVVNHMYKDSPSISPVVKGLVADGMTAYWKFIYEE